MVRYLYFFYVGQRLGDIASSGYTSTSHLSTMPITVNYKHTTDGADILLDVYLPNGVAPTAEVPAVVYFHGGGLTLGDRTIVAPWLLGKWDSRVLSQSIVHGSSESHRPRSGKRLPLHLGRLPSSS